MDKFLGVGLRGAVMLSLFTMLMIVISKVVFTKYPVKGVSEFFQSV